MARFLVIGLGRFGSAMAHELAALRQDVLGVDLSMQVVEEYSDTLHHVVQMDATDVDALRSLDIKQFDVCILSRGSSLEDSVLILTHLKDLGARRIVAKALTSIQARILHVLGADQIVFPERDVGIRMARLLVEPEVLNSIPLGDAERVEHVLLPTLRNGTRVRDVARDPRVRVLALRRAGRTQVNPPEHASLQEGDELILIGPNDLLTDLHEEQYRR